MSDPFSFSSLLGVACVPPSGGVSCSVDPSSLADLSSLRGMYQPCFLTMILLAGYLRFSSMFESAFCRRPQFGCFSLVSIPNPKFVA